MKKKGFTLIELLAVIVILAIILLIATPIILNVLEDVKKSSFKATAGMIVRTADSEYSRRLLKDPHISNLSYEYVDGEFIGDKDLDYRGKRPKNGIINITEEGEVELAIHDGTYCAWKKIDSDEIYIKKTPKEECERKISSEYVYGCFTFDEEKRMITDYDLENCPSDVVIPKTINEVPVEHIGPGAFAEPVEQICSDQQYYYHEVELDYIHTEGDGYSRCWFNFGGFIGLASLGDIHPIKTFSSNFSNNKITSVILPENLKTIKYSAFYENEISELDIPNNVIKIEDSAFYGNQLTSLNLGNKIRIIEYGAFDGNWLSSINLPDSLIELSGFSGNQITSVDIPNSVTKIFGCAFSYNQLTEIIIPNGIKEIGDCAFHNNQIATAVIPDSVEIIRYEAFNGNKLTEITIPNSVIEIEGLAFSRNELTNVTLGNSVTRIGDGAFYQNQLTEIFIPNSVTKIEGSAFNSNKIIQGNAIIDNNTFNVTVSTNAFRNNGLSGTTHITPVFLR